MRVLTHEILREQARSLSEGNRRLVAKILESIDAEKANENKERECDGDQSKVVFRYSKSQPF